MAQHSMHSVEQDLFSVAERRQSSGAELASPSPRTTTMFQGARNLQFANSTFSVAGGDVVHNHYYNEERPKDIWASLQSIPNFRSIYQDMLSKVTPGTGMWLLEGDKFRLWLDPNGDIKIFWGSGIPGAGKTLLACIVIEHLESLCKDIGSKICVCYVYFRYSERAEMTVRNILESLVKQTLERHPDCRAVVENAYARHLRESTEPTEAQLLGLLQELADCMTCTFFILDALDEAPTKIQLAVVKAFASLNVKVFITSRVLKTVESYFPQAHTFPIIAQDVDLDLHIAKGIDDIPDLQHLLRQADPSLREEVFSTVKQNCGGMFLHAALQLDALSECLDARDVRETLQAFPSSIEDFYHQTWARICSQGRKQALATCPDTHRFKPDLRVTGATLISLCRGLVIVEEESRLVRLVHYTAKDTLEDLLRESFPHPHSYIANVCMTHLTGCGFQTQSGLRERPLLAYASEAWVFHARAGLSKEESEHRTANFINKCNAFPAFTSLDKSRLFDILAPLHIVGLYHLPWALAMDVSLGNLNEPTKLNQQTPLIIASRSGHEGFVAHLISLSDVEVNLADAGGCSALMMAAWHGHKSAVKLLLAYPEIQINLVDHDGWSALMLAANEGREGVIELLLAYPGIQVNLVNDDGWSAFMVATSEGYEGVAKLLLAHPEIQVNLVNSDGWSALIMAANDGHEGVVKLLLECPEIQVNLVNSDGQSALMRAARYGLSGVVKFLLAHLEIQISLTDSHGSTALFLAAE
ncbi:hypothetical protein BKA70DRAFT_1148496, partial [Coprinopsis sp. MPI-PUGE-AT-0042]